jgi:hypothetical protein
LKDEREEEISKLKQEIELVTFYFQNASKNFPINSSTRNWRNKEESTRKVAERMFPTRK